MLLRSIHRCAQRSMHAAENMISSTRTFSMKRIRPRWKNPDGATIELDFLFNHQHFVHDMKEQCSEAVLVNDATSASVATKLLRKDKALFLVYQGDYHNARQLLSAIKRRIQLPRKSPKSLSETITDQWLVQRRLIAEQGHQMNRLLIQVDHIHQIQNLRRAPCVSNILSNVFGTRTDPYCMSLRELLGMIGAQQWYEKGIHVSLLEDKIHPHFGVFTPIRQEHFELVDRAANDFLPFMVTNGTGVTLMDVGIGTGVLSAIIMKSGKVNRLIGTDINPKALDCARDNLSRLGQYDDQKCELISANIFPEDAAKYQANLIVCNPPWVPGSSNSSLDLGVYDSDDASFLQGFLENAHRYIWRANDDDNSSEVWLIMSNMAELLGLRSNEMISNMIDAGNLDIIDVYEVPASPKKHTPKSSDDGSFAKVNAARANEVVKLYRMRRKQ